jgi:DedD protein
VPLNFAHVRLPDWTTIAWKQQTSLRRAASRAPKRELVIALWCLAHSRRSAPRSNGWNVSRAHPLYSRAADGNPMETRVKARLIGALILVALIVLLVPEMLSGPRQNQKSHGEGSAAQTYTIDLTAPTARVAPSATDKTPPPPPAAPADDLPTETVHVESTSEPAAAQPSEEPASGGTESPPSGGGADISDQSAWVVQLGSFASDANAARLAGELKSRGYKAFVSRLGSGSRTRFRVRVGPEQERARAENLAERLRRDGRQAVVVPNS